jgi:hypothetical protein
MVCARYDYTYRPSASFRTSYAAAVVLIFPRAGIISCMSEFFSQTSKRRFGLPPSGGM